MDLNPPGEKLEQNMKQGDDTSFAFLFSGIGIGFALTDKIDLRAQFQGPNVLLFGAGVLSGGITYHF